MITAPAGKPNPHNSASHTLAATVCAVVVTYQPGPGFIDWIEQFSTRVGHIVIVDNGSHTRSKEQLAHLRGRPNFTVEGNDENVGLGAGLNQGVNLAREAGFSWVLTLDQDSRPEPGMLRALLNARESAPAPDSIALIAPVLVDRTIEHRYRSLTARGRWFFRRTTCDKGVLEDVLMVLGSGTLHNVRVLEALGGFREDFFIDYLDTEYCLRARRAGHRILVACEARIQHRLGDRQRRNFGPINFLPTFHSPMRWYTISRNRIPMFRMYALRFPNWLFFELVSTLYILLRMLCFEDQRRLKLKALSRGTIDGLRRRMGPIPADIQAMLERSR